MARRLAILVSLALMVASVPQAQTGEVIAPADRVVVF